ncbi:MAG TPA: DUF1343 domain-containing protein [Ohtaekwangia sp.]|nr:DUF1343 domain-containing protein [Ohtaekwangia sp.]
MPRTILLFFLLFICARCNSKTNTPVALPANKADSVEQIKTLERELKLGAEQLSVLLPLLKNKSVALLVNHTATIGSTHLVDTLMSLGVDIKKILGPEHGFRGNAADGELVAHGKDTKTGLPVISLYGKNKKPTQEQLADVDIVIFDIQDVGTRFYTYISTLHYLMEACAENGKRVVVLDRPNPHGGYVDGPMLQPEFKSFVGMHPIPVVHGLTVGELANMINGEGWLAGGKKCDLDVVTMKHWKHGDQYDVPIAPSPNLPNDQAIKLYPSLCFFEGTVISVGRGTEMPFQVIGNPLLKGMPFTFTPVTIKGVANQPLHENKLCYGLDLRNATVENKIDLSYLINMYNAYPDKDNFFTNPFDKNYINKLAGNALLQQQIRDGLSEDEIRKTWQKDLEAFEVKRKRYLLYP